MADFSSKVLDVFEFWKKELNHPKAILDKKRAGLIQSRLKEGYTEQRIKEAIIGIQASPHHMGQNDRQTVYDDLELICRTGANIDKFADMQTVEDKTWQNKYKNLLIGDYTNTKENDNDKKRMG